jgi:hypothetical protein
MANFNIDYLVVAGGGGGASASSGNSGGGAGGAGGYRTSYGTGNISGGNSPVESALNLTIGTSYTITVGDGGAGGPAASPINQPPISGTKGDNSVFASITSEGGGYGEGANLAGSGGSGGSAGGGGGGSSAGSGGTGTSSQGSNGGAGTSTCVSNSCNLGGGGGGASQAGSSVQDGKGGDGLSSSITGSSVIRAGGGSGGSYGPIGWNDPIAGGAGGGGDAGVLANGLVGQPGTTNTGGGGGGATWYTNQNSKKGGDGGSGIVILRYATADANYTTTGSTPTEDTTTIPGQTILSFTTVGTGSITFTTPPPPPFSGTKVTTPVTDFNKPNTEEGLKIPSGASSEQPTGVTGMVRNDTNQSSKGSASAITYYNGTDWRYFENELNTSFNTVIYTGSTSPHAITGVGFAPDLIWIKNRDQTDSYAIVDSVRGITSPAPYIASDSTAVQATSANMPTSVQSDGFTITGNGGRTNTSGEDYVAWCFKAGGLINKAADFNGSGSIQSSISKTTLANNFSVSFWWKPDLMNTTQVPIGGLYDETGGLAYGWMVYQGSDNKMYLYWIISASPNLSNSISNDVVLEKGKWYHVVVTKTSSSASIYVDKSSASSSPSQGNIFNIVYNTNPSFIIGNQNVSSYYANGIINQIRVFTSALSASQVTELYNETAADNSVLNYPNGAGCVAAYPLGENANGVDGLYNGSSSNVTFGKPGYLTRNTEGTIESTVSANNDLGFSIVSWSGNSVSPSTVGHGLGVAPELFIIKNLSSAVNWSVYSSSVGAGKKLLLNEINQESATSNYANTSPTSSVFSLSGGNEVNGSGSNYVAYCFTSKPNYSKIGSFIGTNQPGNKQTTGFEPAFVMIKRTSTTGSWTIIDNKRTPLNKYLSANSNAVEASATSPIVFEDDGFSFGGTGVSFNQSGETAIYLAFANTI